MNEFERGIDPKEAMGLGYAALIKKFDDLGKPYNFTRENVPKDPFFWKPNKCKWVQHWANSWGDLISLYEEENGTIRVFYNSAAGDRGWDQPIDPWLYPEIWASNFNY